MASRRIASVAANDSVPPLATLPECVTPRPGATAAQSKAPPGGSKLDSTVAVTTVPTATRSRGTPCMLTNASRTPTGGAICPYQLAYGAKSGTSPAPAATPFTTARKEGASRSSSTLAPFRQHDPLR